MYTYRVAKMMLVKKQQLAKYISLNIIIWENMFILKLKINKEILIYYELIIMR